MPMLNNVVLMLLACLYCTAALSMEVARSMQQVDLAAGIQVLEDPGRSLSVDDVRRPDIAQRFRPATATGTDLNFGFSRSAYWLRLPLRRMQDAPGDWLLEIPYVSLNELDFHAPGRAAVQTGSDRPLHTRAINDRYYVFPLTLSPDTQYFHLRVSTQHAVTVPLRLWQTEAYAAQQRNALMIQFLYYGALLALLLYNLFLFFSLQDVRFLAYSLYALSFGLGIMAGNGFGRLLIWPDSPFFDNIAQDTLLSLSAFFGLLFTRIFLQTRTSSPRIDRALQLCAAVFLLCALLQVILSALELPLQQLNQSLTLSVLPALVLILVASLKAVIAGDRSARFFLLSWGVLWLGAAVAAARAFGWLPTNGFTSYSLQIASAFEMLLLSLALAELIRQEKARREQAQAMAIEAKSRMLESLQSSEDRLEQTVRERTAQLENSLRHEKELLARYMRFSSLISHEFRNPLSIITSQLSLLRKEQELGQVQFDKRLGVIASATRRLQLVFDRWLQSDRLGHSLHNITPRPIALQAWLEHVVEANAYCLTEHRIELHCTAERSAVLGDEYLLEMALSNLIDNACKYSPPGSLITLETRALPGRTGLAVIDRGPGIAPEHQQAVFTEYFRVAPEGAVRGMGLGLSIVQRIVEAHGGQLQLESVPGHGCTFCIWLPEPNRRQQR